MQRVLACSSSVLLLFLGTALLYARVRSRISPEAILADIRFLTSPGLGGRDSGSEGLRKASEFIAGEFSKAGLRPAAGSSFFQSVPLTIGAKAGSGNKLRWSSGGTEHSLKLGQDFEPQPFSSREHVKAPLVFAGYGITACEYGYDDYAAIDAHGKVVLILRHEPQEYDASSPFDGRVYTEHSQIYKKLLNAKEHGAAGVLLVNDTANHSGPDNLDHLTSLPSPGGAGLPFMEIKAAVAEQWFLAAGKNFAEVQSETDRTLHAQSFVFPNFIVDLESDVTARSEQISNVVGYLPGATSEYVVVGAHYDHLGNGEQFSLAPDRNGTLHPGADDNASGTAAVIELARWFGSQPGLHRGVVFATFAGEEIGLLGSTQFTSRPPLPLSDAVAMINMDMIGRMREHKLIIGGLTTGTGFRELIDTAARQFPFDLQIGGDAVYGSSDHTAFTSHSIPTLFFFTGLHADYHRPGDTLDKIDGRNTALIADLVASVITSLTETAVRPQFVSRTSSGNACVTSK